MANGEDPQTPAESTALAQGGREVVATVGEAVGETAASIVETVGDSFKQHQGGLDALYNDKYKNFFLQYPANVDNAIEERHWIRFDVKKLEGQKLKTADTQNNSELVQESNFFADLIGKGVEKGAAVVKSAINAPFQLATTTANEFLNDVPLVGGVAKEFLGLNQTKARGLGSILLYAPFQRTDTAGFTWETGAATGFLGNQFRGGVSGIAETIRNVAGSAGNAIRGNAQDQQKFKEAIGIYGTLFGADLISSAVGNYAPRVRDQLLKGEGVAFNNHLESFFKDVQLRQFQFQFQLSPRTPQEARTIQEIIKMFKYAGHPEQYEGLHGVFFAYPQVFDIEVYNESQTHKIGTSALTNMSATYGGDTMNLTFYDKYPVQITLSLTFTELEIIDKSKVDEGF